MGLKRIKKRLFNGFGNLPSAVTLMGSVCLRRVMTLAVEPVAIVLKGFNGTERLLLKNTPWLNGVWGFATEMLGE